MNDFLGLTTNAPCFFNQFTNLNFQGTISNNTLLYSQSGIDYTITGTPNLGLYAITGAVSVLEQEEDLSVSFTSTNVFAIGFDAFLTDISGNPSVGLLTITVSNSTDSVVQSVTNGFIGFASDSGSIISFTLQAVPDNVFPTLSSFYAIGPPTPPLITMPTFTNNTFSVSVQTLSGENYVLEFRNSLQANWMLLTNTEIGGNGLVEILSDSTATNSQRFYRLQQW